MSDSSVKSAIHKALTLPAGKKKADVTRDEAREILKAATTEKKGPAKIGKGEAQLLARLAGESTFEGEPSPYNVTPAAARELEQFFVSHNLPIGKNAEAMRARIDELCAQVDYSRPLSKAPSTTGLHKLLIADDRPVDGALREAYIDPNAGTFLLKSVGGFRRTPGGETRWFGPISLKGAGPAPAGDRAADLARVKAQIAEATKDLLYTSESDYPFEYFQKDGAGKTVPTQAEFLKLLGKPADTAIETRSAKEFFDRLTTPEEWWGDYEKEQAARYTALRQALESNLTDLQVFRVGEIEIGVHIVGRNPHGDLVGVSTISIET